MGAWIETDYVKSYKRYLPVAPYVGAWIETAVASPSKLQAKVAPYVGAWIETVSPSVIACCASVSHLTWVRGLKHPFRRWLFGIAAVAPYVGAWIETNALTASIASLQVAPYVGAWIETAINI